MRILQVIFNLSSGGAERFVTDLSNELAKSDDVSLLTLMDDSIDSEKNQFYKFDLNKNVHYKNLGLKEGGGFSFNALWKVYKAIKDAKPDVVHIHLCHNFCMLAIFLLCRKVTFVQTLHIDFAKVINRYDYRLLFKTVGRLHKMRWAALSPSNYEDMIKEYPYLLGRCIINGRSPIVPTEKFDEVKAEFNSLKINNDTKVYLHIARCSKQKNQKMLVRSFNEFVNNGCNAVLLIIGAGFDSDLGLQIKALMGSNVHYLGAKTNVSDYLLNSDCFCLSSLYEGLPITILEAMLAGKPVVCTPFAGALDVLTDGYNSIISTDYSKEEFVKSLKSSYDTFSLLEENARNSKDNCPYTMKNCASEYMSFYQS